MLNRRDIEATLRALLMQFQLTADLDTERIVRFAQVGAEALQMQTRRIPGSTASRVLSCFI